MRQGEAVGDEFISNRPAPLRVEALRLNLIDRIPCDAASRQLLLGQNLTDVLWVYMNYAHRHIPPRERRVAYLPRFWNERALKHITAILALERKIIAGHDLTPHLSDRALLSGHAPAGSREKRWGDHRDFALNAYDIHHLHLEEKSKRDDLLFVRFWRSEACFLFLGNHKSFHDGSVSAASAELKSLSGERIVGESVEKREPTERTQFALRTINVFARHGNDTVMDSALLANGDNFFLMRHADRVALTIEEVDPKLDDATLYPALFGKAANALPHNPVFRWDMHYSDLLIVEERTQVGYPICEGPT